MARKSQRLIKIKGDSVFIFSSLDRNNEEEVEIRGILNNRSVCIVVNTKGLKADLEDCMPVEFSWEQI